MSFVRWEQKREDICQTRGEVKEYSREKKRWDFKREREREDESVRKKNNGEVEMCREK